MVNLVIVVLGASLKPDGQPTKAMVRRTQTGCRLAQETGAGSIIFSGGRTRPELDVSEADVMANLALGLGVSPDSIVREGRAMNTMENAIYTRDVLGVDSDIDVVVVTDRPHLLRTRLTFRAVGMQARYVAASGSGFQIGPYLYEIPALLWYGYRLLRGDHKQINDE